jgi:gluconolactonase
MTRLLTAICVATATIGLAAHPSTQLGVPRARVEGQGENRVVRLDPALDALISPNAKAELLKGDYFGATEGPVWTDQDGGYLLFSDMAANVIYKWTPSGQVSVFLEKSGYTGNDLNNVGGQYTNGRLHLLLIGSNGLTLDRDGRLIIAGMTDRNVTRLERDGTRSVLAAFYQSKRLNSPNDLVVKSDGAIYFTETTSGIRGRDEGPAREIAFHGLYLIKGVPLRLLDKDPQGAAPNGIAFSPDEKILYVNGGTKVTAYDVRDDDTLANPRLLIDTAVERVPGNTDGMKVDRSGNIYFSGPGGVWIVSPQAKHLGTIVTPERVANLAFGDADSKTLYMVGGRSLWRIRVNTAGIRPMTRRNE